MHKWRTAVRLKSKQMSEKTNVHQNVLFQSSLLWKLRTMAASTPALTHNGVRRGLNQNGSENTSGLLGLSFESNISAGAAFTDGLRARFHRETYWESCCWVVTMWASRRTHWRMSPAAPPGRFVLKNHSSIWVMSSKREPFNRGGHRWTWQRLTPASVWAHLLPSAVTAAQKAPRHVQHEPQTRWCNTNAVLICSPSQYFSTPSPPPATGSRVI